MLYSYSSFEYLGEWQLVLQLQYYLGVILLLKYRRKFVPGFL